jgi:hypothetical protein
MRFAFIGAVISRDCTTTGSGKSCLVVERPALRAANEFRRMGLLESGRDSYYPVLKFVGLPEKSTSFLFVWLMRVTRALPSVPRRYNSLLLKNVGEPYQPDQAYRCPCCHFKSLDERGGFSICPVCFGEDDGQDDPDADEVRGGPNASGSLTQARANFLKYKNSGDAPSKYVRDPLDVEPRQSATPGTSEDVFYPHVRSRVLRTGEPRPLGAYFR